MNPEECCGPIYDQGDTFSIKLSFSSIGQGKSKLQIQTLIRFGFVALSFLVLYLRKIVLSKMCILYWLLSLNLFENTEKWTQLLGH